MALKAGDAAPDFKLSAMTGAVQGEFRLSAHRGKNVVICFYPLDFTPVCQSELAAFQGDLAKFAGANTQVMGVSTDTIFSHQAFQQALGGLSYPLLADRWPYAETAGSRSFSAEQAYDSFCKRPGHFYRGKERQDRVVKGLRNRPDAGDPRDFGRLAQPGVKKLKANSRKLGVAAGFFDFEVSTFNWSLH